MGDHFMSKPGIADRTKSLPRRKFLQMAGTTVSASFLPSASGTSDQSTLQAFSTSEGIGRSKGQFFTRSELTLVEELAETIIPADNHSGGAKAAKVADYIERVVRESIDDDQKRLWREGLRLIDEMSRRESGQLFVEASPEQRIAVLKVLSDNEKMIELPEVRFFHEVKRLTVDGYYTSRIGILEELQYKGNTILEEFVGCDDATPNSK
jgi:hypothetical protein